MSPFFKAVFRAYILCNVALICLVTWLLLTPDPGTSLALQPTHWAVRMDDLLVHGMVFSLLTIMFTSPLLHRAAKQRRKAIGFLICYAVVTEFAQSFVPGRFADPADGLANIVGITCGLTIVFVADRAFQLFWQRTRGIA